MEGALDQLKAEHPDAKLIVAIVAHDIEGRVRFSVAIESKIDVTGLNDALVDALDAWLIDNDFIAPQSELN